MTFTNSWSKMLLGEIPTPPRLGLGAGRSHPRGGKYSLFCSIHSHPSPSGWSLLDVYPSRHRHPNPLLWRGWTPKWDGGWKRVGARVRVGGGFCGHRLRMAAYEIIFVFVSRKMFIWLMVNYQILMVYIKTIMLKSMIVLIYRSKSVIIM